MPFYAKNQLVWAKIKGYPWWPAIVAKSNQTRNGALEDEVLVNFIGENSHAVVAMDKVADFDESFEEHSSSKNKRLMESIKTAQRILEGVSTYEEEKGRLLKRLSKPEKEEKSPEKPKPMKLIKKKELGRKESLKAVRPTQKSKEKESRMEKKYELLEYMPHRFTRSRSKQENIEMLTEPLIYNSRKSHRSPLKGGKRRLTRSSKRRSNRRNQEEDNEDDQDDEDEESGDEEDEEDDEENEGDDSEDDEEEGEEEVKKTRATKKIRRTNSRSAVKVAAPSKATVKRRTRGGRRHLKKTPASRRRMEDEEEESKKSDNDTPMSLIKESRGQKNKNQTDQDLELEKMLEDVEDEDCESFDLNMDLYMNDMKQDSRNRTEKRLNFSNHDNNDNTGDTEWANGQNLKSKDSYYANSSTKTVMAYNSLKIRKFENDLEQILNKMSKKFLSKEKLQEEDPVLIHLLNVIQEFENNTFNGVEFINSDLGKLFKTVHFIFTKNKDLLCKTADSLIAILARVLHKIKNKIIQHCLDNSDYIESLNLPDDQRESSRQTALAAINVDEGRTKVEEPAISPPHNVSNGPIITKMEDEDTMRRTRSMQANSASGTKKDDMVPTTSNVYKNESETKDANMQGQQTPQVSNFQLRKKICQKFAALLQRAYSMERGRSQELTLQIEEKINNFYLTNVNDYKQAIKRLLKIIKAGKLEETELVQIQDLKLNDFSNMLKQKLETITNFIESPEPSVSTAAETKSEIQSQKNNNKAHKEPKEAKERGVPARKSTRSSTKEAPSTDNNNIEAKLDEVHGPILKEEPERASYQDIVPIPTQTQFQQKIEFV